MEKCIHRDVKVQYHYGKMYFQIVKVREYVDVFLIGAINFLF